jgi:hypothetical protein
VRGGQRRTGWRKQARVSSVLDGIIIESFAPAAGLRLAARLGLPSRSAAATMPGEVDDPVMQHTHTHTSYGCSVW